MALSSGDLVKMLSLLRIASILALYLPASAAHVPAQRLIYHSTHPAIEYLPRSRCVYYTLWWCAEWEYSWETAVYTDERNHLNRSLALSLTPEVKEIVFAVLSQANTIFIYGAPRSQTHGLLTASQELCIGRSTCFQLDVQDTYSRSQDEDEPVLIWSGAIPPRTGGTKAILRSTEPSRPNGQAARLMTLDHIVFLGVPPHPSHPHRAGPAAAEIRDYMYDDRASAITYRPSDRWNVSARLGDSGAFEMITQTSTKWNSNIDERREPMPELPFRFTGAEVTLWSAAPSRLTLPPGGVKVCLDRACELVDVFHLYINPHVSHRNTTASIGAINTSRDATEPAEFYGDHDPIPIWSVSGLDYRHSHQVSVTLVEHNPDLDKSHGERRRGLTLDHISYTQVLGGDDPDDSDWLEDLYMIVFVFLMIAVTIFTVVVVIPALFIVLYHIVAGSVALIRYIVTPGQCEPVEPPSERTPLQGAPMPNGSSEPYSWLQSKSTYSSDQSTSDTASSSASEAPPGYRP